MLNRALSRDFYSFTILFLVLHIISVLIQGVVSLQLGSRILTFDSFYPWLLLFGFIFAVASVAMLRYFLNKGYRIAFTAGLIHTIATVGQIALVYNILMFRNLQSFFVSASATTLVVGILFGFALAFSNVRERPWLMWSGIMSIISGAILLVTMLWFHNTQDIALRLLVEKIHRLTAVASICVPIMFLLNMLRETKAMAVAEAKTTPIVWRELLKVLGILGILFFGMSFVGESIRSRSSKPFVPTPEISKLATAVPPRNFVNATGDTLRYRLMFPASYDSTKQYPMVVCLHHGGAHGKDNMRQLAADPAPFLFNEENRKKYPAFIFMPHCPEGEGFGGIPNYPNIDTLVIDAINTLKTDYPVDAKRLYVMGISSGGYGSWHFIGTHPEMFAAAIPICGGGDPKMGKVLTNMPIWAFHGAKDRLAPVSGTRDIIDAIEKAGGKPKYTEYKQSGHDIWRNVKEEPHLMDWLFAQKKD
ncbi:prolyl oligopeptidase family serine peptidase [Dyadobacter sp. CY326]|uniref:carboxylesterase family protein n=1 Tax=Dyadobacter sp. CY326 TaxID=2907300 RepID=UPI001F4840E2|nr:prolyl oligopeptidase family serine peptidase [Dyadobacter sp. CY326]MCE7063922.1 prolyl oligopeptidase family serine peptidase [Dyadobacter sp. CY326]